MSADRSRCLESIVNNSKVSITLITDQNLQDFILSDVPLHSGFNFLSATHKSDYLRSYFMFHYGGGYTDIKKCEFDWNLYFDLLDNSEKQFIGYRETSFKAVAYKPYSMSFNDLVGSAQFIFKPSTEIAKIWVDATNQLMDKNLPHLISNPGTYHPRAIWGGVQKLPGEFLDSRYPFAWNQLMGRIFQKIQKNLRQRAYRNLQNKQCRSSCCSNWFCNWRGDWVVFVSASCNRFAR
jgi:hypothetical protein